MGVSELLKRSGGLLAGLSGSIAGISALLYAAGFIATKSADQTLGIEFEFAARDPVFYIRRGGLMLTRIAVLAVGPAVAVIVVLELMRRGGRRLGTLAPGAAETASSLAAPLKAPAASLVMVALVVGGLAYCLDGAPKTDGLLFETAPGPEICALDRDAEEGRFLIYAAIIGVVGGVGVVAGSALFSADQWFWACLAGFALFLALIGTPIVYGYLAVKPEAPRVWIEPFESDAGRMWLLSRGSDGALVWLEEQRMVEWVRSDKIETLRFGRKESIMSALCDAGNAPPEGE